MKTRVRNVLFLCTGNSARSIIAEAIPNRVGRPRFHAFSAGSHPKGTVNPHALRILQKNNHFLKGLHSKDWFVFTTPEGPVMDFVITLCDQTAGESCPIWPGQPITAHWGFPDPAKAKGTDAEIGLFFATLYGQLLRRLEIFVSLPMESLDRLAIERRIRELAPESGNPANLNSHLQSAQK